jgi:hypothetical protein
MKVEQDESQSRVTLCKLLAILVQLPLSTRIYIVRVVSSSPRSLSINKSPLTMKTIGSKNPMSCRLDGRVLKLGISVISILSICALERPVCIGICHAVELSCFAHSFNFNSALSSMFTAGYRLHFRSDVTHTASWTRMPLPRKPLCNWTRTTSLRAD